MSKLEEKFLLTCGYTKDEVKLLIEGFGVTDPSLPEGPEAHPNVLSPGEGGASPDAKSRASAQYSRLLSILTNLFRGKVPPEIVTLTSEIQKYFAS